MDNIKPNIGLGDNLANLKEWKQLFGELAQGYIDPSEPRKLAPGEGWGAGTGKLLHKYFFDMPVGALKAMGELYERGMQDPEAIPPLDYTASTLDAMFASMPGGGTGVANIGKRDALKSLGRSGIDLAQFLRHVDINSDLPKKAIRKKYSHYLRNTKESLKALNTLPQKELDRIDNIWWKSTAGKEYGSYTPDGNRGKEINLTDVLMEDSNKEAADTLFHEMTHARQWSPDRKISEIIKARALRRASGDFDYKARPIEQLARSTSHDYLEGYYSDFDQAYRETMDAYLKQAKGSHISETEFDPFQPEQPGAEHWAKLKPLLKEGVELAKKLPEAKKKIQRLRLIADKAKQSRESLMKKNAPIDVIQRAENIVSEANRRQVPYYRYLNELGLELK